VGVKLNWGAELSVEVPFFMARQNVYDQDHWRSQFERWRGDVCGTESPAAVDRGRVRVGIDAFPDGERPRMCKGVDRLLFDSGAPQVT
jgi:hypothetical protein